MTLRPADGRERIELGHSRPPVSQDVYLGRRAFDKAVPVLDAALRNIVPCQRKKVAKCGPWRRPAAVIAADLRFCAPSGTRTPNPLIKSQLLCQLS